MADLTDDVDLIRASRQAWGALETVHVLSYFAEEVTAAFVELGLRPRLSYFAARSAAFGAVGPEVPTATFYVFAPWLPAKALPSSWSAASPDEVQQARRDSMGVVLERVLGDVSEVELGELLALVPTACEGLTPQGRPLYAAHSGLAWPDDPRVALWHAAGLVREHRGDGHIAVLLAAGLARSSRSCSTDFSLTTRPSSRQREAGPTRSGPQVSNDSWSEGSWPTALSPRRVRPSGRASSETRTDWLSRAGRTSASRAPCASWSSPRRCVSVPSTAGSCPDGPARAGRETGQTR